MSVIQLFKKSNNACHANAKAVLEEAIKAVEDGRLGNKVIVIGVSEAKDLETLFIQSGMKAFELISLLEVAKMNIYSNYMNGGDK